MNYQWYPGHMTKAKRMMQENMGLIDLVIEVVDARIPLSSRNPDIDELGRNKFRVILLNKSDLADAEANRLWMEYFKEKGFHALEVNAKSGQGLRSLQGIVREACREKIERDRRRGIKNRPIRAIVVGIPNVGKSTFINSFAGKACTKTRGSGEKSCADRLHERRDPGDDTARLGSSRLSAVTLQGAARREISDERFRGHGYGARGAYAYM